MTVPSLLAKRLSAHAVLPSRGSPCAAGLDLSAAHDFVIPARGKGLVKTDLAVEIPFGWYGRVAPRSGLALKQHIDVGAGVIDSDYRGNVGVVLFNHADQDFSIAKGDRIAQLIIEKCLICDVVEVAELQESVRGDGGYGSTGVSATSGN